MIEWWLGRHSFSSMRSGLCVELSSGHGESKSQNVTSVQNACFNVEALIEIEGFKVGPKRSHVALRNLRIERCKSRSSSSSSSSSEPFLSSDFELALVFDKPGQYILPISDITRIRCKHLQQGKASIEAKGSLILFTAVTQGDLERLLLFIRDVKTGKTLLESRSCVVCREKGLKAKLKREELQSSENSQTSKQDGDCQATKKQKTEVLDCIFRKRQLLHVNAGQDQVLKQLRELKNREHGHKSKKMDMPPSENENRPDVVDREVYEPGSKVKHVYQETMRHHCGRENSGSHKSPTVYSSRSKDGQDSRSTSPTFTRAQLDERCRRVAEDVRTWERPGTWSGRIRERESLSPEGEKENFKGEEEVRRIGEETVRRLAEERRRVEEEKRRVLEEQRRRAEEEHRRVLEEQRKKYEDERRRREEERRHAEERERISQDETRRRDEKERQKEELRKLVEEQELKRKEEKERRALEEERRRKEAEDRILQELWRHKHEEERLRKELERRIQEQEQLRKQEEERRRKEEEDQRLIELMRQKDEEQRVNREQERRLQEQVLEVKRRQQEEKKKQEALRRQRQVEERLLQKIRKKEELRRQKHDEQSKRGSEEERRPRQDSPRPKGHEDLKMRMLMEEERKKEEENRRRALEEQREKLEQRRLDEEMRQWQRMEDHRRAKEDKWKMSDEERTKLEEQRRRVEEVMKMTRELARKRREENVKEVEKRQAAAHEFCRKFVDEDKRTLDEDIQELVDKASNVGSLEEVLVKLRERCTFRSERVASGNVEKESPNPDRSNGMSYLFTRLEEKKKALKEEQVRIRKEEARLNVKPDNSADSQAKAEKRRHEELKRHEVERERAEKAANTLKKKLLQEQLRAAKLEARRLERTRKEAEKRTKAEDRAKQQQKAHEQARKQAQEQAKQKHYPSAPQRWPSHEEYQEYEESWNVIKISSKGSTLGYADIPWPPAGNPLFIESGDSVEVQKRKLRIALLRWHPDKFMALCGDRLGSIDRESIETQAKHLAQQVIQWKGRLEQA